MTERNKPKLIKRIALKYPRHAAKKRMNGFVKMAFDINEQGKAVNIKVVDASPKHIFNESAISALSQWQYNPKVVNGNPVYVNGYSVQLDFAVH